MWIISVASNLVLWVYERSKCRLPQYCLFSYTNSFRSDDVARVFRWWVTPNGYGCSCQIFLSRSNSNFSSAGMHWRHIAIPDSNGKHVTAFGCLPASEMTYTVSSGTLNPIVYYTLHRRWQFWHRCWRRLLWSHMNLRLQAGVQPVFRVEVGRESHS